MSDRKRWAPEFPTAAALAMSALALAVSGGVLYRAHELHERGTRTDLGTLRVLDRAVAVVDAFHGDRVTAGDWTTQCVVLDDDGLLEPGGTCVGLPNWAWRFSRCFELDEGGNLVEADCPGPAPHWARRARP